ncbi:MAG: hypothetical protein RMM98_16870 [Acidobacteriota bacterium]|nr:hypothetical protein [Blastocatellia bacterium]MDW8241275.1 hypothetical protein [Acidobacteriota bacterium]
MVWLTAGCVSRSVQVPILLPPVWDATVQDLVASLNEYQRLQTMTARLAVQFQNNQQVDQGLSRLYRAAEGRLVLARPGKIRLLIQAPVVKTNIAEVASDGHRFSVIIHPDKYRMFIRGTNGRQYDHLSLSPQAKERRQQAGGFARLRPEHFTEALLFPAIDLHDPTTVVVKEEVQREEPDLRPNAPRGQRVIKTYWVLDVIQQEAGSFYRLRHKYWFDRTGEQRLVRQQAFAPTGELVADISFSDPIRPEASALLIPTSIHIHRPRDQYSAWLRLDAPTVQLNVEVPERAFTLEKPTEWGDDVETIDLDSYANL